MATKKKKKPVKAAKKAAKKPAKKTVAKKISAKAKKAAPKKATKAKTKAKATAKKAAPRKASVQAAKPTAIKTAPKTNTTPNGAHPLVGSTVPSLTLPNQSGTPVTLSELVKKAPKTVLYFYPKDDTPGCTMEACDFRDNMNRLKEAGLNVVGVSPDDQVSHQNFIAKHGINFDLLSDTDKKLSEALKVWKQKSFMGRDFLGVERSTFLIDQNGKIVHAWQPVNVKGHVDEILTKAKG